MKDAVVAMQTFLLNTLLMSLAVIILVIPVFPIVWQTFDFGEVVSAEWVWKSPPPLSAISCVEKEMACDPEDDPALMPKRESSVEWTATSEWSLIARVYDWLSIPLTPSYSTLLGLVCLSAVLWLILMAWTKFDHQIDDWTNTTLFLQGLFAFVWFMICLLVAALGLDDIKTQIRHAIPEADLATTVISETRVIMALLGLCPALIYLVVDVVALVVYSVIYELPASLVRLIKKSLINDAARRTQELGLQNGLLMIRPDGTVEYTDVTSDIHWWPIPTRVLRQVTRRAVDLDTLFRVLMGQSKTVAFRELGDRLLTSYLRRFHDIGVTAAGTFLDETCALVAQEFRSIEPVLQEEREQKQFGDAERLLQVVSDRTLARFKQDNVAGIGEAIQRALAASRERLTTALVERITTRLAVEDESANHWSQLPLLPYGTRFFLTSGNESFIVIEEPPQTRTLTFSDRFVKHYEDSRKRRSFQLALPYTIFIMRFVQGWFRQLQVAYATSPLQSIEEPLYYTNFPNAHNDGVCLGEFSSSGRDMGERAVSIISGFWQSTFNMDHTRLYDDMRRRDPDHFQSLARWERCSKDDPSFVLGVSWFPQGNLSEILGRFGTHAASDARADVERLVADAFSAETTQLGEVARDFCKSIKVEDRYRKSVVEELSRYLSEFPATTLAALHDRLVGSVTTLKGAGDRFDQTLHHAIEAVLREELEQLAGEVLMRRQGDYRALVDHLSRERSN